MPSMSVRPIVGSTTDTCSRNSLQEAAYDYSRRGWSLIPIQIESKRPAVRWRRYQTTQTSRSSLWRWFAGDSPYGLGVVFGSISGGLGSRDFDDMAAYDRWVTSHPELAASLPTVRTHRGRHVYFQTLPQNVADFRASIGKPDGTGAIPLDDGELRIGIGCYSLIPPSPHPKGGFYEWVIPLGAEIPVITDFAEAGLFHQNYRENGEYRGLQRITEETEEDTSHCSDENSLELRSEVSLEDAVERAIQDTLPTVSGERNRQVFELARALKAIPALAAAQGLEQKEYVRRWHQRALPHISTEAFEVTLIDFLRGWPKVRFPRGSDPMEAILSAAKARQADFATMHESEDVQLTESLCRELQRSAGDGPFYLACRKAGKMLAAHHTAANGWLFLLEQYGRLQCIERGSQQTRRATRFRYLGPM